MLRSFIRILGIISCTLYINLKILNPKNKNSFFENITSVIFSTAVSIFIIKFMYFFPGIARVIILIILVSSFTSLLFHIPINVSITSATISYSLSYMLFALSIIQISIISNYIEKFTYITLPYVFVQCLVSILQFTLSHLLFHIPRFKNGMPFLYNKKYNLIGIYIGIIVLICSVITENIGSSYLYVAPIVIIIICIIFFILWWQNRLKLLYKQKSLIAEINRMDNQLYEAMKRIKLLEEDNRNMSLIIHKDNKLIPALELATQKVIKLIPSSDAIELSNELKKLSNERAGILTSIEIAKIPFTSCGITYIDLLISYMHQKATSMEIRFNFNTEGDFNTLFNKSEFTLSEFTTLLADLVENAILSAKTSFSKAVQVTIKHLSDNVSLEIYDSGPLFDINIIKYFGKKQITTHANESGSGIGLMNTYHLMLKYKASFIIDEKINTSPYSKRIIFIFNKKNQFILRSKRNSNELIELYNCRRDLIIE